MTFDKKLAVVEPAAQKISDSEAEAAVRRLIEWIGEDPARDASDVAGLEMLAQHAGDDFVADLAADRLCILRTVKDRRRAEERGRQLAGHGAA